MLSPRRETVRVLPRVRVLAQRRQSPLALAPRAKAPGAPTMLGPRPPTSTGEPHEGRPHVSQARAAPSARCPMPAKCARANTPASGRTEQGTPLRCAPLLPSEGRLSASGEPVATPTPSPPRTPPSLRPASTLPLTNPRPPASIPASCQPPPPSHPWTCCMCRPTRTSNSQRERTVTVILGAQRA